jgi:hypothetical protein
VGEAELKAFLEDKGVSPELATQLTTRLWEMVGGAPTMAPTPASDTSSPSPALDFDDAASRYEDRGLLGRGGMGEVRLVFDRRLNRELAMKVLRAEISADAELMDRFLDEAQVTAQLQHPSIIPLHDRTLRHTVLMRALLQLSARDVTSGTTNPRTVRSGLSNRARRGPDLATGAGLVDVGAAVLLVRQLQRHRRST